MEGNSSGISGSYDTILMLIQNAENNYSEYQQQQISKVSEELITNRRSLEQMLYLTVGISRHKDVVCQWNIIKHEKEKFQERCCLNEYDEYVLQHDY